MKFKAERIITPGNIDYGYFKEILFLGYENIREDKNGNLIISFYKEVE